MIDDKTMTVSDYLLTRLKSLGVDHVFGIPGDFILPFFQKMDDSGISHVAACNELNAGYAADGYARLRGLAAVAATYGPGAFSFVNAAAGALAERVPVVFISGGPETESYKTQPILHHLLPNKYDASMKIFEQVTVH
ncbi:MAG: alpha-keto acid decarboxylase family protein, partial [Pseudomonadales bacterium]|nr:alpha-keto acid decarboxylase family protein [Pseudomonadales bacterium]